MTDLSDAPEGIIIPDYLKSGLTAAEYDLQKRVEHSKAECEKKTAEKLEEEMKKQGLKPGDPGYEIHKNTLEAEIRSEVESFGVSKAGSSAFDMQDVINKKSTDIEDENSKETKDKESMLQLVETSKFTQSQKSSTAGNSVEKDYTLHENEHLPYRYRLNYCQLRGNQSPCNTTDTDHHGKPCKISPLPSPPGSHHVCSIINCCDAPHSRYDALSERIRNLRTPDHRYDSRQRFGTGCSSSICSLHSIRDPLSSGYIHSRSSPRSFVRFKSDVYIPGGYSPSVRSDRSTRMVEYEDNVQRNTRSPYRRQEEDEISKRLSLMEELICGPSPRHYTDYIATVSSRAASSNASLNDEEVYGDRSFRSNPHSWNGSVTAESPFKIGENIETETLQRSALPLWMTLDDKMSAMDDELEIENFQKSGANFMSIETESSDSGDFEITHRATKNKYRRNNSPAHSVSPSHLDIERSQSFEDLKRHWKELEAKDSKCLELTAYYPRIEQIQEYESSFIEKLRYALWDHFSGSEAPVRRRASSFRDLKVYSPMRSRGSVGSLSPASSISNIKSSRCSNSRIDSPGSSKGSERRCNPPRIPPFPANEKPRTENIAVRDAGRNYKLLTGTRAGSYSSSFGLTNTHRNSFTGDVLSQHDTNETSDHSNNRIGVMSPSKNGTKRFTGDSKVDDLRAERNESFTLTTSHKKEPEEQTYIPSDSLSQSPILKCNITPIKRKPFFRNRPISTVNMDMFENVQHPSPDLVSKCASTTCTGHSNLYNPLKDLDSLFAFNEKGDTYSKITTLQSYGDAPAEEIDPIKGSAPSNSSYRSTLQSEHDEKFFSKPYACYQTKAQNIINDIAIEAKYDSLKNSTLGAVTSADDSNYQRNPQSPIGKIRNYPHYPIQVVSDNVHSIIQTGDDFCPSPVERVHEDRHSAIETVHKDKRALHKAPPNHNQLYTEKLDYNITVNDVSSVQNSGCYTIPNSRKHQNIGKQGQHHDFVSMNKTTDEINCEADAANNISRREELRKLQLKRLNQMNRNIQKTQELDNVQTDPSELSPDDTLTESEKQFYEKLAQTEIVKASMTGAEITRLLRDRKLSKLSNISEIDEAASLSRHSGPDDCMRSPGSFVDDVNEVRNATKNLSMYTLYLQYCIH